MSGKFLCAITTLPIFLLAARAVPADVVWMNNGDRITGDIKRVWDNELFLETPYADEFPIALDAVARIESDGELEFFHDHRYWVYLTGRTNQVADTSTGIRWDVWGDVYMNVQVDWDWESSPAAGNEREDVTYVLGIGLELD